MPSREGAVPWLTGSPPQTQGSASSASFVLPSPRKGVWLLSRLARRPVLVFLDTLSFLSVFCTSTQYSHKAPDFSGLSMFAVFRLRQDFKLL